MKILVTGASGFLGGRLCDALLRQGYSVRVLVRSTSDISSLSPDIEIFHGDITNYASLLAACSSCTIVFHLAALVEPWLPDPSKFFNVSSPTLAPLSPNRNSQSLSSFSLGQRWRIEKRVSGDKGDSHGGETPVYVVFFRPRTNGRRHCRRESSRCGQDCGASCIGGVPIVLLYPGVIYGPGKVTAGNVVARMIVERFSGRLPGYIGYGSDKFSFSHVEDVVEGHISAMKKGQVGSRYLLTGENASFNHVFDMAAAITDTKKPVFSIPLWVIEVYGWLSVLFSRITGKLPLISPPTVHVLRQRWEYSCDKAKSELDYRPRRLKEGLAEVLLWLKNSNLIKY
ncbi:hypothetical protein ACSQ67_018445 [Phaseolus vulgaris]